MQTCRYFAIQLVKGTARGTTAVYFPRRTCCLDQSLWGWMDGGGGETMSKMSLRKREYYCSVRLRGWLVGCWLCVNCKRTREG